MLLAIVFSKVVSQLLFSSCLGPTSETSSSHLEIQNDQTIDKM